MANPEHLSKLKEGVEPWNGWLKRFREEPDLSGADLGGAQLSGADFRGAYLDGANLAKADLRFANLAGADLRRSNLRGAALSMSDLDDADLSEAVLNGADLTGVELFRANLNEADLYWANFNEASLSHADLSGARIGATIFARNDLSTTKGLSDVIHLGPSTVGIDTIYKSRGKIPLTFLRGCGVPDSFITLLPSLTASGYQSCFISYSSKDQAFADHLHVDLQNNGVRCWFAQHDVQGGKKLHEQIDDAIRVHERLLLILSLESMSSEWVKTEIRKARKRERVEKKRVLFPVGLTSYDTIREWELFDADEGKDLAIEIREYYIPDFSEWKDHDLYQKEFEKLLRDLRTDEGSKS